MTDIDALIAKLNECKVWLALRDMQYWYSESEAPFEAAAALKQQQELLKQQQEEIARLQNEVSNRNDRALAGDKAMSAFIAEYDRAEKAEAERDALKADAELFAWVEKRMRVFSPHIDGQHYYCATGDIGRIKGPTFRAAVRAAIDAAMKEGK
jgi:7-keto-8-aminopelargonate synthetase-like enzyme